MLGDFPRRVDLPAAAAAPASFAALHGKPAGDSAPLVQIRRCEKGKP